MAKGKKATNVVINSLQFGELDIAKENIFTFSEGILGFEDLKQYVLINDDNTAPFKWLLSIDNPDIGFPIISPWLIDFEYIPGKDYDYSKIIPMVIVTIGGGANNMTANLKAPILLNIDELSGVQIIIPNDKYSTNELINKIK